MFVAKQNSLIVQTGMGKGEESSVKLGEGGPNEPKKDYELRTKLLQNIDKSNSFKKKTPFEGIVEKEQSVHATIT